MSTLDLIKAIASGSAIATEESFNQRMAEKISTSLDAMRQEVARTMFNTVVEEETEVDTEGYITEEEFDALSDEEKADYEPINEGNLLDHPAEMDDDDEHHIDHNKPKHIVPDPEGDGEHHIWHHKGHTIISTAGQYQNSETEKFKGTHGPRAIHKAMAKNYDSHK